MIAIVLVRGLVNVSAEVKDTLAMLHLKRKNHCTLVKPTPTTLGMIKRVKDYITWGEVSEDTVNQLVEKRGETYEKGKFEHKGKKYKAYFRLNPPKKGFGRKGIKVAFKVGGALGDRQDKMNDLIQRMLP